MQVALKQIIIAPGSKLLLKDVNWQKKCLIYTYTLAASLYYLVAGETPTNSLSRKLFK